MDRWIKFGRSDHTTDFFFKISMIMGANETRQLASYSNSTRSKLDLSELDSKC